MMLYSVCNYRYEEYMFGKWLQYTCKEKVFSGRCSRCKEYR